MSRSRPRLRSETAIGAQSRDELLRDFGGAAGEELAVSLHGRHELPDHAHGGFEVVAAEPAADEPVAAVAEETVAERFDFGEKSRAEIRALSAEETFKLLEEKLKEA